MVTGCNICCLNVRGLTNKQKRIDVFEWLKQKQHSIYLLQEFHGHKHLTDEYLREWGYKGIFNFHTSDSRGVAILFLNNFDFTLHDQKVNDEGNLIVVDITIETHRLTLVNLYGPNKDDPPFYNAMRQIIDGFDNASIIMGGDWNMVMDYEKDTHGYNRNNNPRARIEVLGMMEELNLSDIWRINNPDKSRYTWKSAYRPVKMSRLDFFLVTDDLMNVTCESNISSGYRSDHSLVSISLNLYNQTRGRGFWKLNTSLLFDETYKQLISELIRSESMNYNKGIDNTDSNDACISDQLFLDTLKLSIRGRTISYSAKKAKCNRETELTLSKQIEKLEQNIGNNQPGDNDEQILDELGAAKLNLEQLREEHVKGIMIRSKVQNYEEGEKPTKYFLSLEKKNYNSKVMREIELDDKVIKDPEKILAVQTDFYKHLYTTNAGEVDQTVSDYFLSEENIEKLDDSQRLRCEGPIKMEEILTVLKNMKNNKTPGNDGFPAEFYKIFWKDLGPFVLKSINEAFEKNELSITQKQGVITCLPKGNKSRRLLKNWRPITLLNTDYKLLSGVLANRMKSVLPDIISTEQKGFLKNRFIGENTRLVYDIISELNNNKTSKGMIMLIDFEKAFDTVGWKFINQILGAYNFGDSFKKWFEILYRGASSCVINNGHFSGSFQIGRGCRQGDPLSPYIFILAIEPLAAAIRNAPTIKGIHIKNKEYKIGQYADDTFLLLDGSEESIYNSFNVLENFGKLSGLKVNKEKTQSCWLNRDQNETHNICTDINLNWVTEFKLLGITLSYDLKASTILNFQNILSKVRNILKIHSNRNLTIMGKSTIIKTFAIPQIIHVIASLPTVNKQFMKDLYKVLKDFLWDGKRSKISWEILSHERQDGGLNLPNLEVFFQSLKISWIKRLMAQGAWQTLFADTICEDKSLIWELDRQSLIDLSENIKNIFWKEVITAWCHFRYNQNDPDINDILKYPIWYTYWNTNPNILSMKRRFIDKGIIYLKDLINDQRQFYTHTDFQNRTHIKINFLEYLGLIGSIPRCWKNTIEKSTLTDGIAQIFRISLKYITNLERPTNAVYRKHLETVTVEKKPEIKWENTFNKQIDWKSVYSNIYSSTLNVKVQSFQFKLVHRILPTNKFLHICKIKETEMCYFCNSEIETFEHLFFECTVVRQFWYKIKHWLNPHIEIDIWLNTENIILGIITNNKNSILINHIFLLAKRCIFSTKYKEGILSLSILVNTIRNVYNIEQKIMIADTEGKYKYIVNKWKDIEDLLNE